MLAEGLLLFSNHFLVCSFQLGLTSGFNFSSTFHLWWVWKTWVPAIVPQQTAVAPFLCSRKRYGQLPVIFWVPQDSTAEYFFASDYQAILSELRGLGPVISAWSWRDCTVPTLGCPWTKIFHQISPLFAEFGKKHGVLVAFLLAGVKYLTEATLGRKVSQWAKHGGILQLCQWQWEPEEPHSHLSRSGSREREAREMNSGQRQSWPITLSPHPFRPMSAR